MSGRSDAPSDGVMMQVPVDRSGVWRAQGSLTSKPAMGAAFWSRHRWFDTLTTDVEASTNTDGRSCLAEGPVAQFRGSSHPAPSVGHARAA
jgi:hypothetical protein